MNQIIDKIIGVTKLIKFAKSIGLGNFIGSVVFFLQVICSQSAANINIMPIMLTLKPTDSYVKVEISNPTSQQRSFHGRVKKWIQVDGQEIYQDVSDWIVSPTIFTIGPGKTQLIRLAPKNRISSSHEGSFRFVLMEIPNKMRVNVGQVKMIFNIILPLFIETNSPSQDLPKIERDGHDLILYNPNNHHLDLAHMSKGKEKVNFHGYLLPGERKKLPLSNNMALEGWTLHYGYLGKSRQMVIGE